MLKTQIIFFGQTCLSVCDHKCEKAWGHNGRRHFEGVSIAYDEDDDHVFLADHEVGIAPDDPGTYEGCDGKPMHPEKHNKWCVRECERNAIIEPNNEILLPDFSKRRYNIPSLHPEADLEQDIGTGEIFIPERIVY